MVVPLPLAASGPAVGGAIAMPACPISGYPVFNSVGHTFSFAIEKSVYSGSAGSALPWRHAPRWWGAKLA